MQTLPRASLRMTAALIITAAVGCQGLVGGIEQSNEQGGEEQYAACTSYHACCPPADLVCEGDVDTSATCTCKQLWTCHPGSPQKCEAVRVVPPAGGAWSCTWSEEHYQCTRPGSGNPFPDGGQGRWSCQGDGAGWSCHIPPPNPSNTPGGEQAWGCTVDDVSDHIVCLRQGGPACVPAPEVCTNGKDDDCDGKVDCADPDCTEACKPKVCTAWKTVACSGVGHCNTHLGDDLNACKAAGNAGGCDSTELYAWCTRRVAGLSGAGGPWWSYIKNWVESRCGGPATLTWDDKKQEMDMYVCEHTATCNVYKCETPLVLSFDPGEPVIFTPDDGRGSFDFSPAQDGTADRTDWPTAATPWLVLDRDGDGVITSGRELFGSATRVEGSIAQDGFEALAPLDQNSDGVLDARDPGFAALRLWSDRDGDRVCRPGELTSLAAAGVVSLGLHARRLRRCDSRGNCEVDRAAFSWRGPDGRPRRGAVVDVHLSIRPRRASPTCDATFSLDVPW